MKNKQNDVRMHVLDILYPTRLTHTMLSPDERMTYLEQTHPARSAISLMRYQLAFTITARG